MRVRKVGISVVVLLFDSRMLGAMLEDEPTEFDADAELSEPPAFGAAGPPTLAATEAPAEAATVLPALLPAQTPAPPLAAPPLEAAPTELPMALETLVVVRNVRPPPRAVLGESSPLSYNCCVFERLTIRRCEAVTLFEPFALGTTSVAFAPAGEETAAPAANVDWFALTEDADDVDGAAF
jgi:hypothetical protein